MATKASTSEFGKTLGFGISSLVKGKKDYYILEHLVGSHYHTSGEKQEIMLDEVVLGRNPDCHVRFDESFKTVSRHHARIVRDGDNWRLIQLSEKNSTFLNGKPIQDSWYLQSGDEIQLAVNGPKLIFRIPTDKSGMSLTQRFDSFRDQVIRPYQTAFTVVCCVIALLIIGAITSGIIIHNQSKTIKQVTEINDTQRTQIENLIEQLQQTNQQLARTAIIADSAQQDAIRAREEAFNSAAESLKTKQEQVKTQEELDKVQEELQQLQNEINSFYNGILNGEKPEVQQGVYTLPEYLQ